MRLFLGLSLPKAVLRETGRLSQLASCRIPGRYTAPQHHHITLAFLGEVPEGRLPDAHALLTECLRRAPAPLLLLDGCGYFGAPQRAIFIVRVKRTPDLCPLHEALIRGAQMRALPFDPGPFSPHITLARRAVLSQEALDSLHPRPLSFRPTQAHVFLSARDAQGSLCYTPLASAPFA